jgi:hypothetical protein
MESAKQKRAKAIFRASQSRTAKARSRIDLRLFIDLEARLEPLGAAATERRPPLEEFESLSSFSTGAKLLDSCWSCLCMRRLCMRLCMRSSSRRLGAEALASELFEKVIVCGSFEMFESSKRYDRTIFYETKRLQIRTIGSSAVSKLHCLNTSIADPQMDK